MRTDTADLIESLQEDIKIYRGFPNEPLMLEELRGMDGEPVWTVTRGLEHTGRWELLEFSKGNVKGREVITMCNLAEGQYDAFADTYGQTWLAYRHPPERSKDDA